MVRYVARDVGGKRKTEDKKGIEVLVAKRHTNTHTGASQRVSSFASFGISAYGAVLSFRRNDMLMREREKERGLRSIALRTPRCIDV